MKWHNWLVAMALLSPLSVTMALLFPLVCNNHEFVAPLISNKSTGWSWWYSTASVQEKHCYKSTASAMMAKNFELLNLWCALSLQSWCPIVYCFHINLEVVIKRPTSRIGKQLIVFYPQSSTIYAEINFTIPGFKLSNN